MPDFRNFLIMLLALVILLPVSLSCEREGAQESVRTDEGGQSQGAWTVSDGSSDADDDDDDDALPEDYGADTGYGNMDPSNPIAISCDPNNLDAYELALLKTTELIDMRADAEIEGGDDPAETDLAACAGNLISSALRCAAADQDNKALTQCLTNARDAAVDCGYEPADVFNPRALAADIMKLQKYPKRMTCLKNAQAFSDSCGDWDCLDKTKERIEDCVIR